MHAEVGVLVEPLAADLDVAGGQGSEDLAAAGFVPPAAQHAVAEGAQLVLGQRSLAEGLRSTFDSQPLLGIMPPIDSNSVPPLDERGSTTRAPPGVAIAFGGCATIAW